MGRRKEPIRHGTTGGHRAHYRHKVPMCELCRDAERRKRGHKPMRRAACGTPAGYNRHRRLGEDCETCRRAATAQHRLDNVRRRQRGLPPGDRRHGTTNGYASYGCRCPACTEANRVASAGRQKRVGTPGPVVRVVSAEHPHGALTGSVIPERDAS